MSGCKIDTRCKSGDFENPRDVSDQTYTTQQLPRKMRRLSIALVRVKTQRQNQ